MEIAFVFLEILSTIAFSISGALVAINKKMDIFGVTILGLVTATFGGATRDIILGVTPPTMFINIRDPIISVVTSLVVFIKPIRNILTYEDSNHSVSLLVADSIGLGLFTVIGVKNTISLGYTNAFLAISMGVVTAAFGGVLRDLLAAEKPYILVKHFYATASIIGAVMCFMLYSKVGMLFAMIIGAIIVVALRICAAVFKWNLPKAD